MKTLQDLPSEIQQIITDAGALGADVQQLVADFLTMFNDSWPLAVAAWGRITATLASVGIKWFAKP